MEDTFGHVLLVYLGLFGLLGLLLSFITLFKAENGLRRSASARFQAFLASLVSLSNYHLGAMVFPDFLVNILNKFFPLYFPWIYH